MTPNSACVSDSVLYHPVRSKLALQPSSQHKMFLGPDHGHLECGSSAKDRHDEVLKAYAS